MVNWLRGVGGEEFRVDVPVVAVEREPMGAGVGRGELFHDWPVFNFRLEEDVGTRVKSFIESSRPDRNARVHVDDDGVFVVGGEVKPVECLFCEVLEGEECE